MGKTDDSEALARACAAIEEILGTCPLDYFDEFPADNHDCVEVCENKPMPGFCWQVYFRNHEWREGGGK